VPVGAPALTIAQISASTTIAGKRAINGLRRTSGTTIDHAAQVGRLPIRRGPHRLHLGHSRHATVREELRPAAGRQRPRWVHLRLAIGQAVITGFVQWTTLNA
jgi:hypothetical protein